MGVCHGKEACHVATLSRTVATTDNRHSVSSWKLDESLKVDRKRGGSIVRHCFCSVPLGQELEGPVLCCLLIPQIEN